VDHLLISEETAFRWLIRVVVVAAAVVAVISIVRALT
jgi:hypothetical protein